MYAPVTHSHAEVDHPLAFYSPGGAGYLIKFRRSFPRIAGLATDQIGPRHSQGWRLPMHAIIESEIFLFLKLKKLPCIYKQEISRDDRISLSSWFKIYGEHQKIKNAP